MESRKESDYAIQDLPTELLLTIFAYLSSEELNSVALTCQLFYQLAFDHSLRHTYSPLDYTKHVKDNDKIFPLEIEPGHIVPLSNDLIIIVNSLDNIITLLSLQETLITTVLYQDETINTLDNLGRITAWTKISNYLFAFALDHDGIYLWDLNDIQCIKKWVKPASSSGVWERLLVTKNNILLNSLGNTVYFWDLNNLNKETPIKMITLPSLHKEHIQQISHIFTNTNEDIVIITDTKQLHVYDKECFHLKTIDKIPMNTQSLQLLPNNKLIGVCKINYQRVYGYVDYHNMQYQLHIFDLNTEESIQYKPEFSPQILDSWCQYMGGQIQLINHTGLIAMNHECCSSNGCSVTNMRGKGMTIWDTNTGQCVRKLIHEHLDDFAVMPNFQIVTIGGRDNKELRIWHFDPLVLKPILQEPFSNEKTETKTSKKKHNISSSLPSLSLFNKNRIDQARRATQVILHTASKVLPLNRHK